MRGREGGSRPVTRVDRAVVRVHDRGGQGLRTGAMTGMDRAYTDRAVTGPTDRAL